jgi:hypothetical protein
VTSFGRAAHAGSGRFTRIGTFADGSTFTDGTTFTGSMFTDSSTSTGKGGALTTATSPSPGLPRVRIVIFAVMAVLLIAYAFVSYFAPQVVAGGPGHHPLRVTAAAIAGAAFAIGAVFAGKNKAPAADDPTGPNA